MGVLWMDFRIGARQLASRPGFAAAAIASLALGIGLDTALFSVLNAVLTKDAGSGRPERLVEVYTGISKDLPRFTSSYPDYLSIREGVPAFDAMAAHAFVRGILSGAGGGQPSVSTGEVVSAGYFDLLGVRPALGRGFLRSEEEAEMPVIVLSHGLWQRRFAGRAEVLGQDVALSGVRYTVVGVAPATFTGAVPGVRTEFWAPLSMVGHLTFAGVQSTDDTEAARSRLERRGTRWLFVKARLRARATAEEAGVQLATVFKRLQHEFPATNRNAEGNLLPASAVRFHPLVDGHLRWAGAALMGAVSLVLLVACANVANLLLARGASRRRELAVRAALGASRGRLVRQLLAEGLVLSLGGGLLGVLVAHGAGRVLQAVPTTALPVALSFDFGVDARVLAFALLLSLATTILCGLLPAWSASRPGLVPALKSLPEAGARGRRFAPGDVLVVGQLATALLLLACSSLLVRGLFSARGADLGFDPRPLSSLSFNLQMNGYDLPRALELRRRMLAELRALPGVAGAALTSRLPLEMGRDMEGLRVPGHHQAHDDPALVDVASVEGAYFAAVGVPIVEGRPFTEEDVDAHRRVAVVNQAFARKYWPGRSAVGQAIFLDGMDKPAHEIVGVARDHAVRAIGEAPVPYLHLPAADSRRISLVVRTRTPAEAALPMLRAAILALEPEIVFTSDETFPEVVAASLAPAWIGAALLGGFGGLALLLAAVGLYGVIAYSVNLRTREIGVRMALGAVRGDVLRLVLRQGGRLALMGVAIGGVLALAAARLLGSMLHGVGSFDALAYASAAAVLLAVTVLANLLPALQAARTDPLRALRTE